MPTQRERKIVDRAVIDATTSDRQVVDAVLAGDREAFRVLVDRESWTVIGICRRILGDPMEAEDAAQDTFTKAFQSLGTYRGDGPFGAWLRRIALRTAIARLATHHDARRLDDELVDPRIARLAADEDPETLYLGLEHRADVLDAIAALPAAQRDIVLLRFFDDLTLLDIARITDNPIGTVKSRLSRGVTTLRDQLGARSVS